MYATLCGRAIQQRIVRIRSGEWSPEEMLTISGADRFGRCRLHAEIYEPIVNYLGIAGGIVKRGSALETSNRGDHSMLQFPPDQQYDYPERTGIRTRTKRPACSATSP